MFQCFRSGSPAILISCFGLSFARWQPWFCNFALNNIHDEKDQRSKMTTGCFAMQVTRTSVQLSFRTFSSQGIILVSSAASGDFLSLMVILLINIFGSFVFEVVDKRLRLQYNLGSGVFTIFSREVGFARWMDWWLHFKDLTLGTWHSVVVKRYHQVFTLPPVTEVSE